MIAHLHCHSDASLKDGLGTVDRLVRAVAESDASVSKTIALTDHGTLANTISFSYACREHGVKPIIGLEAYVKYGEGKTGHMTLLANGNAGFENLVKLNNIGHASLERQPAFSIEDLEAHSKDIILLSGCPASPLQALGEKDALGLGRRLVATFGSRFFVEAMLIPHMGNHYSRAAYLSKNLKRPLVITNDVHFPYQDDALVHPILTSMKAGYTYDSTELWLKPKDYLKSTFLEMFSGADAAAIAQFLDAVDRSANLAALIKPVDFFYDGRKAYLPDLGLHGKADPLSSKILSALSLLKPALPEFEFDKYVRRAKQEYRVIRAMGYEDYFNILYDIVHFAHKARIRVGPGRGSGAGSLILYLLDITQIDPLKYDLSFERFLNEKRVGLPDVDLDFDSERRHEVIEYAIKTWKASPIMTYSRYFHRSLIHDLAKTLKLSRDVEKELADGGEESAFFKEYEMRNETFGQAYRAFLGQIRHKGKHAGGVVITNLPVPLERIGDDRAVAWTEGKVNELSKAGVVKYDLLGLSALAALARLEKEHKYKAPDPLNTDTDTRREVFRLFQKGDLTGIFQFSGSSGIARLVKDVKPTSFEDLVAINALYRPGALDAKTAFKYPEFKEHPRRIHPFVDDILAPTYGVIVYQEQVMGLFSRITGGSLAEADLARRVLVKAKIHDEAWVSEIADIRAKFLEKGKEIMGEGTASLLWNEMVAHTRYSFNKAHAVSYARIAWEMAWWKAFRPLQFYCAMLNIDEANKQEYIIAAVMAGMNIQRPHILFSSGEYSAKAPSIAIPAIADVAPSENTIYMPLSAIKGIGHEAAQKFAEIREARFAELVSELDKISIFTKIFPKSLIRANGRLGLLAIPSAYGQPTYKSPDYVLKYAKDLGLKDTDINMMMSRSRAEREKEILGVVIPTKEQAAVIVDMESRGYTAGFITNVEHRESKYGEYHVCRMAPHGVFWTREYYFKVGEFVAAQIKDGKAISAERIS